MLAAIDGRARQVLFETYIWKGDETGERFKQALTDAAERGVEVYAIYDSFANLWSRPAVQDASPRCCGCCKYPIYNAGWRFFDLRRYGRDHRKVLVVDDDVGFVGGFNIGAAYATEWRDTHVRITGPARLGPEALLRRLLERTTAAAADRCCWRPPTPSGSRGSGCTATCRGSGCSRSVRCTSRRSTGPPQHLDDHAYFIPDQDFVDALMAAARRGVDVKILLSVRRTTSSPTGSRAATSASCSRSGVQIHRFEGAMVHAKTATIDGKWSTVGTANIDRLSMSGNYEINVEFIDPGHGEGDGGDLPHRPRAVLAPAPGTGTPAAAPPVHRGGADPLRPLL